MVTTGDNDPRDDEEDGKRKPWISGHFDETTEKNTGSSYKGGAIVSNRKRYGRHVVKPKRFGDMTHLAFLTEEALCGNVYEEEPSSTENAMKGPRKKDWIASMADEIISLVDNEAFAIVKKPHGCKVISPKWVLTMKRNAEGKYNGSSRAWLRRGIHR